MRLLELQKIRKRGSEKFVNASLRKIEREGVADVKTIKRKISAIRSSVLASLAGFLIEEWRRKSFSYLCPRSQASHSRDGYVAQGISPAFRAEDSLSPSALRDRHFCWASALESGAIMIQDESSRWWRRLGHRRWGADFKILSSAPGGKTVHMVSYLTSGHIIALDLYDHKLELVEENAERLGLADKSPLKSLTHCCFETLGQMLR